MGLPIFKIVAENPITGVSRQVDFLCGVFGITDSLFHKPLLPRLKGGGTFRSSAFSDGRVPVDKKYENVIETINATLTTSENYDQDEVIEMINKLQSIFEQAFEYMKPDTHPNTVGPVYMVRKARDETNPVYFIVINGRIPQIGEIFNGTFDPAHSSKPSIPNFVIEYERGEARSHKPGESASLSISSQQKSIKYLELPISDILDVLTARKYSEIIPSPTGNEIGYRTEPLITGVRFQSVPLSTSDNILDANITIVANAVSANEPYIAIRSELVSNSPAFSTGSDLINRTRGINTTYWQVPGFFAVNEEVTSLSIKKQLEEVILLPGWLSGNNLTIFLDDDNTPSGVSLELKRNISFPHKLNVTWHNNVVRGIEATETNEVYVANKFNTSQITHVFTYNGTSYSSNLIDSALPYSMVINVASPKIYFGVSSDNNNVLGVFHSIVFDLIPLTLNGTMDFQWNYWNGTAFTRLDGLRDNTGDIASFGNKFIHSGINSVSFIPPSDFTTTTINGVLGYWVMLEGSGNKILTNPQQQNRQIFTVTAPYIDIENSSLNNYITTKLRMSIKNQSGVTVTPLGGLPPVLYSDGVQHIMYSNRVIIGSRPLMDNDVFSPFLNCIGEQNPLGVFTKLKDDTTEASEPSSANGKKAVFASVDTELATRVLFSMESTVQSGWSGVFRIYARVTQTNNAPNDGSIRIVIEYGTGSPPIIGVTRSIQSTNPYEIVDMGQFRIPESNDKYFDKINISLQAQTNTVGTVIEFYDIVLMPKLSNFYSGEFKATNNTSEANLTYRRKLVIDSARQVKRLTSADLVNSENDETMSKYQVVSGRPLELISNYSQRFYFLFTRFVHLKGLDDGGATRGYLFDTNGDFVNKGVKKGLLVRNITDRSEGVITSVTATTVTATLSGGVNNNWSNDNIYAIFTDIETSEPSLLHSVTVEKTDIYQAMRGGK